MVYDDSVQYIVNKTGTVHSIPSSWLAEKLASGYRLAEQDEINAHFAGQGFNAKAAPKVGSLADDYDAHLQKTAEEQLIQSTTIGPRPGDVDVRLTQPGDAGFIVGTDGMRQVPSRITTDTLNPYGAASNTQGVGEQDGHVYEAVVPSVAAASIVEGVQVEVAGRIAAATNPEDHAPVATPTSVDGPAPFGTDGAAGNADGGNPTGNSTEDTTAKGGPRAPKSSDNK